MKVNVKDSAKCQKILEIEIPKETVADAFNNYFEEVKKTAQLPGFRKGKAPRELVEQYFADKAHDKVLTNLVSDTYREAVAQEKIHPVAMPNISNVNFKKDEKMSFQVQVDVRPMYTLKEYAGIKIKKQVLAVDEVETNKILGYLRERYAQFLPIEQRPTKIGDWIVCDFSYSVEGKEIEQKNKAWLTIDSEMFIPGLSTELEGIAAGQKKEFSIVLPKKFQPAELAQKTAQFNITIHEIKEKKLPELNDEFAAMVGEKSLEELKTHIKEDLTKEKETQIKQDMRAQLIAHLVKSMPIDVPSSLLEKREQSLRETFRQRAQQQGMNEGQIAAEEKNLEVRFKEEAMNQVRIFFILEDIAKKENIVVEEHEMDARIGTIAQSYNQKKEE
ncbi:MAG: trigger factor, partial [Victivallales bacterium]|nr:trigger factor [Victivallales bacterium]